MAPRMRFRFRKRIPLLGRFLSATVSKKGVSLNLRAGPLSKSWGTRGKTTTLDMPGTSGMFWRKEEGRRRTPPGADDQALAEGADQYRPWAGGQTLLLLVLLGAGTLGVAWTLLHPLADCEPSGATWRWALLVGAVTLPATSLQKRVSPLHGAGAVVLAAVALWALWQGWGQWISPAMHCS